MARGFPRFLFSNPINTKSKGPFVIHALSPEVIIKVYTDELEFEKRKGIGVADRKYRHHFIGLEIIHTITKDEVSLVQYEQVLNDALMWLVLQLSKKEIQI
jgi:hypothetical protein